MKVLSVPGDALIVVDMQNDFLPNGCLVVPGGDKIIPVFNRYIAYFYANKRPILEVGPNFWTSVLGAIFRYITQPLATRWIHSRLDPVLLLGFDVFGFRCKTGSI